MLGILVNFLVILVLSYIYVVLADRAEHLSLVLGTQLLRTDPRLYGRHLLSLLLKSDVWRLGPPDHHHAWWRGIISEEIFGLQICLHLPDRIQGIINGPLIYLVASLLCGCHYWLRSRNHISVPRLLYLLSH